MSMVKMSKPLELFQFYQNCQELFNIHPSQSYRKPHSISFIKIAFLISFAQFTFTTVAFLVFEAESMFDYGFTFYVLISIFNSFAIYLIFLWQSLNTIKFIENCEKFIKRSEFQCAKLSMRFVVFSLLFSFDRGSFDGRIQCVD